MIAEQVGPLTSCRCFRWLPVQILSTLTHAANPGNGLALNKNNLGSHAYAGAYFAVCSRQQRSGTLHCIRLHIHKHEAAHGEIKVQRYDGTRNLQATGPPYLKCVFVLKDSVQQSMRQSETVDTCLNPSNPSKQDGLESDRQRKVHHSLFRLARTTYRSPSNCWNQGWPKPWRSWQALLNFSLLFSKEEWEGEE